MTRARTAAAALAAAAPRIKAPRQAQEPVYALPPTPEWLNHHEADRRFVGTNTTAFRSKPRYRELFDDNRIDASGLAACETWISDYSLADGAQIGEKTGNGELCKDDVIVSAAARRRKAMQALGLWAQAFLDALVVDDETWAELGRKLKQPDNGRGVEFTKRWSVELIEALVDFYDGRRVRA